MGFRLGTCDEATSQYCVPLLSMPSRLVSFPLDSHEELALVSAANSLSRFQPYPFSVARYYSSHSFSHVHSLVPPHDMLLILPNMTVSSSRAVVPLLSLTLEVYSPKLFKPFYQSHHLFANLS